MPTAIYYCPTCGKSISTVLGAVPACTRCGRQLPARPGFNPVPLPFVGPAPVGYRPAPPPLVGQRTPGVVVALLLYFFFPVGLYLLWTHKVWTERQKWKYTIIWLKLFGGLLVFAMLTSLVMTFATRTR